MTRGAETSSGDPTGTGSTLEGPAPYPPFVEALDALAALAPPRNAADTPILHPPRLPPHPRRPPLQQGQPAAVRGGLPGPRRPPRRVLPARRYRRPDRPADLRRPRPLVPRPPAALRRQVPADPVHVAAAHVRPRRRRPRPGAGHP